MTETSARVQNLRVDSSQALDSILLAHKFLPLRFELLHLDLKLFDNFLASMRPLGQLFFNLFVNLNISFEDLNLRLHFVVFGKELLCLF